MLILGIDFETTGRDFNTLGVTEVGMVVWDTEGRCPVKLFGSIVDPPGAVWEPGVEKVHGLTPEVCSKYGMPDEKAVRQVLSWYGSADAACAHNGNAFDRPVLAAWAARYGHDWQPDKVWIDTMTDIEVVGGHGSMKLTYLAADHGFLNPFPHRATFDVMTMLKILDGYDMDAVMRLARSPSVPVKALVTFDQKDLAKARGFHPVYDNGKFRHWAKDVKQVNFDAELAACREAGFEVSVLRQ